MSFVCNLAASILATVVVPLPGGPPIVIFISAPLLFSEAEEVRSFNNQFGSANDPFIIFHLRQDFHPVASACGTGANGAAFLMQNNFLVKSDVMPVARAKIFCSMLKKGLNGSLKRLCWILQNVYVLLQMGGDVIRVIRTLPFK